ncbi:hypothetical protein QJS66_00080 [Kocuria rhizophila]|nr:hypothetical protein QJS66_00080 [Kocuria rhizophila]
MARSARELHDDVRGVIAASASVVSSSAGSSTSRGAAVSRDPAQFQARPLRRASSSTREQDVATLGGPVPAPSRPTLRRISWVVVAVVVMAPVLLRGLAGVGDIGWATAVVAAAPAGCPRQCSRPGRWSSWAGRVFAGCPPHHGEDDDAAQVRDGCPRLVRTPSS